MEPGLRRGGSRNPEVQAFEAQLALFSWLPEATPKAIERSIFLDQTVKENWGTVCWPAAPQAPTFWTFLAEDLGPSQNGWDLDGEAWPDPPKTVRSQPPDTLLKVAERWRCGDSTIDLFTGTVPAQVEGAAARCPVRQTPKVLGQVAGRIPDRATPTGSLSPALQRRLMALQPRIRVKAAESVPED